MEAERRLGWFIRGAARYQPQLVAGSDQDDVIDRSPQAVEAARSLAEPNHQLRVRSEAQTQTELNCFREWG